MNRVLLENTPDEMFVTAACVVIDPNDGTAAAAAAGHPPPLWWDDWNQRLTPIAGCGPALGLIPDWWGPTVRWQMAPGDALLLYTDGVLDAKTGVRDRWGEERLAELLGRSAPQDAREWVTRLRRRLDDCIEWPDDVTVVAIGRAPSPVALTRPRAA